MLKIKEFSQQSGFSIRMLRYLEEINLLIPSRDENNYRFYNVDQLVIVKEIKSLQDLGFQLKEIKDLAGKSWQEQRDITLNTLNREKEIAEIKSETIPQLKNLLDSLVHNQTEIFSCLKTQPNLEKKMRTLGGEEKFHRTAYSIPILRTIYEDHISKESEVNLIRTDLFKFGQWLDEIDYIPQVFSILNESAFSFGDNLTPNFLEGYKKSWSKFLPCGEMTLLDDFTKNDISQLMGHHDIVIRTQFEYIKSGETGEVLIPYTPIYAMTRLKI